VTRYSGFHAEIQVVKISRTCTRSAGTMLFNSVVFFAFLAIVLAVYYALALRAQNLWLLGAGLLFYGWWDWRFLILLAVSSLTDYFCALKIEDSNDERARKFYLLVSLITNLGILGFFKYYNFFAESARPVLDSLGLGLPWPVLNVVLPVGISFYTFQALSYVIDVYRREMRACRDVSLYMLFITYFPHMVAGPIQRSDHLLPQLERPRRVTLDLLREGGVLMLIGYFKKVAVADSLAALIQPRFADPSACSAPDLLLALYLFAIQIYCDFSGYTDIARGVSKLLGIELRINFNQPYLATSITDFWRRWHISLSTWLRDYVYIPLGGNRHGTWATYRNLMTTMVLGGLWHGANWTFVVWGALHGLYLAGHKLILDRFGAPERIDRGPLATAVPGVFKGLLTFHLVCVTWIFFRADSFSQAWTFLVRIFTWNMASELPALQWASPRLVILIGGVFAIDVIQRSTGDHVIFRSLPAVARGAAYAALVIVLLAFGGIDAPSAFIYFQF